MAYEIQVLPANNPYDQSYSIGGQPSTIPAHVWYTGKAHWSLPILAFSQRPLDNRQALQAYWAPPVPHSGSVSEPQPAVPHHGNSDISMVALRAPKF